jgi:hypothetical protein
MTNRSHVDCSAQIALILAQGGNRFDEIRFQYLSSIYERAEKQRHSVALILISKVQRLLASYQSDLVSAEEKSKVLSNRIKMSFPESSNEVDQLERYYNVSALTKLENRLMRTNGGGVLKTLTNLLLQGGESDDNQDAPSFVELLQSQENEAIKIFTDNEACIASNKSELKSVRLFRESQEKLNSEKLVRLAIKEGPDNPGPINPHMLAIRSLSTMQSLSPQYLKRFISYIDTVFWLEQAGDELKPKSKPKTINKQAIKSKKK